MSWKYLRHVCWEHCPSAANVRIWRSGTWTLFLGNITSWVTGLCFTEEFPNTDEDGNIKTSNLIILYSFTLRDRHLIVRVNKIIKRGLVFMKCKGGTTVLYTHLYPNFISIHCYLENKPEWKQSWIKFRLPSSLSITPNHILWSGLVHTSTTNT